MNNNEKAFLEIIKYSIWQNEVKESPKDFVKRIKDTYDFSWNAIWNEAKIQSVTGLLSKDIMEFADSEVKDTYVKMKRARVASYVRYLCAQDELIKMMNDNGIKTAILKGASAAVLYERPSDRSMGDIDFLVPQDKFNQAKELMYANGYTLAHDEDSNERHIGFEKGGYVFELHHHFSYTYLDMEHYLIDAFDRLETKNIDGSIFTCFPKFENGLVLLAHMCSHLRSGLGLRQIIDWAMYVKNSLYDDEWNNEFFNAAKGIGLDTLAITVTAMCQKYLGLPEEVEIKAEDDSSMIKSITWCKAADDKLCDVLADSIMTSGNFGRKQGDGTKFENVYAIMKREGKFAYLQRAGQANWKAAKKHKILRPFAFIYQIFRLLVRTLKTKRKGKNIKEDFGRAQNRADMLKKLKIDMNSK